MGKHHLRRLIGVTGALALTACASGPTASSGSSNPLARARILSQNELGITITHSRLGNTTAFKWADEHCRTVGKLAVYLGGTPELADTISTWRCQ